MAGDIEKIRANKKVLEKCCSPREVLNDIARRSSRPGTASARTAGSALSLPLSATASS